MRITKRAVETARPAPSGDVFLWDDQLPGFGLRVKPSGKKSYVVQYRNRYRRSRRLTVGKYPPLSPEKARKIASDLLSDAMEGADPAAERDAARETPTVAAFAERFLREHSGRYKKPSSAKTDRILVRKHIVPALGGLPITEVRRADAARLHARLTEAGTPVAANRVLALLGKMLSTAELWGERPDGSNPCRHIRKNRETQRRRFLSDAELARLGVAIRELESEGAVSRGAAAAFRILALSGMRLGEVLTLQWDFVDYERGFLNLPDSKTGAKPVPLTPALAEVLRALPRDPASPWIIPGHVRGKRLTNPTLPWRRVRERAGLPGVRIHDLRHTHASVSIGRGYGLPVAGALLGHKDAATTARYAHLADDPIRKAAEEVSGHVAAALGGRAGAEVLPLRRDRA